MRRRSLNEGEYLSLCFLNDIVMEAQFTLLTNPTR